MSKTMEDLKAAFAGESQANRKYLAFAKKAEEDDFPQVAKLFRAVAAAETIHAHSHFRALGEIKSTSENLQAAIAGENYEVTTMYPDFIADAQKEEMKRALTSFNWAWEVEKIHEQLYHKALETLGKSTGEVDYYVCPTCGFTHEGPFEGKCPVCNTSGDRFQRID
ncbi:MAG: rubrerythrin [Chloroflexi bacterium GWB2_49_20]|nr:MAG: rubrerythrin [Chloroflexi bacterium GWB2_49_20]OGN76142.1 MAG: rubrerythrin [Chloroflexi bacterium GWC2_49_37]OGN83528.1 MAG: rubrerythrin [Chloroflexi bacterium GWD2_49_16]HBG73934.1 rubrerythrin [Anaerolineae bacterium]HCM96137.1 rubrerythrin [Anaerolineae bacterium]